MIDYHSLVSLQLDMRAGDESLGRATGFFHFDGDQPFLITNWHVLSGRNNNTGQPRHVSGAVPEKIRMSLHSEKLGEYHMGFELGLYHEDVPQWIQHKSGQAIDIAAIKINIPDRVKIYDVVQENETSDMAYPIASEVFVLGFPLGLAMQGPLPVWKRATIASEPSIDIDGQAVFLIDTATREGMSGAPVICYARGLYTKEDGSGNVITGISKRFVGIYSGRYGANEEFSAQLGRVWKRSLLEEMLNEPVRGSYCLAKV